MKLTDQQLCIGGLLAIAAISLVIVGFTDKEVNVSLVGMMGTITGGLLGYLKGKKDSEE
ncbi:MAG: hypothetical protein JJW03_05250 [Desulfosarcina sp.]|nr:hypothetical protein [Desulfobacterales bacterium]